MIIVSQLIIWIIISTAGFATSLLLLHFRYLVMRSVSSTGEDSDLIAGARQTVIETAMNTAAWLCMFILGILSVLDVPVVSVELTWTGQIVGWLLLISILIFEIMTVSIYTYALRRWWESSMSSQIIKKKD